MTGLSGTSVTVRMSVNVAAADAAGINQCSHMEEIIIW